MYRAKKYKQKTGELTWTLAELSNSNIEEYHPK
jgi:hypothetical protein